MAEDIAGAGAGAAGTAASGAARPGASGCGPAADPVAQLRALGVPDGATLLVHASLRGTGLRDDALLDALRAVLGPRGTLVVPAFTPENSDTSPAHLALVSRAPDPAAFRAAMAPFDPDRTPCPGMGRLAERVRTTPGAVRSGHPQTSFAALGDRACELMKGHAPDCHFGEDSPLPRLIAADARVLLAGVGFEACTVFHFAEYLVPTRPARTYRAVIRDESGEAAWFTYQDAALDDSDFARIGADLPARHVRRGPLGRGGALLFPVRAAVEHAAAWMAGHRT
ncbi:AAC(3) family N-acetyltransferase [Streptomyces sp. NPDC006632]|uniref:aminoglycoside N(3)-acetyltransferase n=1 Tax=Streptomyces sp. NPDC006632 TaxID=3157182 RepID=UPI0033BE1629